MALIIQHNLGALQAQRTFGLAGLQRDRAHRRLGSGLRINVGQDGPADLIISEQLRAQSLGIARAVRNNQEANNVLGIAEGALHEMSEILRRMRDLALHAANTGITSPRQVRADQAEIDAGVEAIDRIAQSTGYSNDLLLNGGKRIEFRSTPAIGAPQLLDLQRTRIDQILGYAQVPRAIDYAGATALADNARLSQQASRAWVEAGATAMSRLQIDSATNTLLEDQVFRLTGDRGSQVFRFARGTSGQDGDDQRDRDANPTLAQGQTLVFGQGNVTRRLREVRWREGPVLGKNTDAQGRIFAEYVTNVDGTETINLYKAGRHENGAYAADDLVASGTSDWVNGATFLVEERNESGLRASIIVNGADPPTPAEQPAEVVLVTQTVDYHRDNVASAAPANYESHAQLALGVDNPGSDVGTYVSVVADAVGSAGNEISVELRDPGRASVAAESVTINGSKIVVTLRTNAAGQITSTANQVRNALNGFAGALVTATTVGANAGSVAQAMSARQLTGGIEAGGGWHFDQYGDLFDHIAVNGLEFGANSGANGELYYSTTSLFVGGVWQIGQLRAYKSAERRDEDLVALWDASTAGGAYLRDRSTLFLNEKNGSGLRIAVRTRDYNPLAHAATPFNVQGLEFSMTPELGLRLYTDDYGSDARLEILVERGSLFDYYAGDPDGGDGLSGYRNLGPSDSVLRLQGQDALVDVGGRTVRTDGLDLRIVSAGFEGDLRFAAGETGRTTLAQVGYGRASGVSGIGQFANDDNLSVNAGQERVAALSRFAGGITLQLTEDGGAGGRTTLGLASMLPRDLGLQDVLADLDRDGVAEKVTLSLLDILSGQVASLSAAPLQALDIIDQAIQDVAGARGRIGALQTYLLQTNTQNLQVAFANVLQSESAIRDADMAAEATGLTRHQIAADASTAMLAQANLDPLKILRLMNAGPELAA